MYEVCKLTNETENVVFDLATMEVWFDIARASGCANAFVKQFFQLCPRNV